MARQPESGFRHILMASTQSQSPNSATGWVPRERERRDEHIVLSVSVR